ncbi:hypothetical protein GPECTOR_87g420 [Gonium pectorale]|uniref:Uncharacterized protein n=1 Tax=Gonium pectorale TaxID=33097 RepID=A0A150G144_GONPE|nr:hypothetical protein GPECTOR_87g420 [Gonium pectorale]|eukprot:KXZ43558.1 hypothetical protein GPECTOR_87g420 [Gonium pectorale]
MYGTALSSGRRLVVACSALQPHHRSLLVWGSEEPPADPPPNPGEPTPPHAPPDRPSPNAASAPAGGPAAAAPTAATSGSVGSGGGSSPSVGFALLDPGTQELARRLASRHAAGGHFFPPSLLPSQLAALRVGPHELWAHVRPRGGGGGGGGGGGDGDGGGGGSEDYSFPTAEEIAEELAARLTAAADLQ